MKERLVEADAAKAAIVMAAILARTTADDIITGVVAMAMLMLKGEALSNVLPNTGIIGPTLAAATSSRSCQRTIRLNP